MAIPVYLQQFKAAGVYRIVWDKSNVLNQDTQIMRLVVGYSEKGPFNIPVYCKDVADFVGHFGNISRKLEKRGVFFHRLALQMLRTAPIVCLNLKKFSGEEVDGATISTEFSPKFDIIEDVKLNIEDVYTTTRFWELEADKLNNLHTKDGQKMDQYINMAITGTKNQSVSYFIRKASGSKVAGFNITVNDWYSDNQAEKPEFLIGHEGDLISDYFAEIYLFKGQFTPNQVLGSTTLKNYFDCDKVNGEDVLKLKPYYLNAFNEPIDTLDTLYNDITSNALGHYVGALIPHFVDKQGVYQSLDTVFNSDIDIHNIMMAFNEDLLEDGNNIINISGKNQLNEDNLAQVFAGTLKTSVLGNTNAPVMADKLTFSTNLFDEEGQVYVHNELNEKKRILTGEFFVSDYSVEDGTITLTQFNSGAGEDTTDTTYTITVLNVKDENDNVILDKSETYVKAFAKYGLYVDAEGKLVENAATVNTYAASNPFTYTVGEEGKNGELHIATSDSKINSYVSAVRRLSLTPATYTFTSYGDAAATIQYGTGKVEVTEKGEDYAVVKVTENEADTSFVGQSFRVNSLDENATLQLYSTSGEAQNLWVTVSKESKGGDLVDDIAIISLQDIHFLSTSKLCGDEDALDVYGTSLSFVKKSQTTWTWNSTTKRLEAGAVYDTTLSGLLHVGDFLLAADDTNLYPKEEGSDEYVGDKDTNYDLVVVQDSGIDEDGKYYIVVSGKPFEYTDNNNDEYYVRISGSLNQEIGTMKPRYLEGYTYKNANPTGTGMYAKLKWQQDILSALTEYKGLRTGLLNKSEIDYRYVIDTFESYPGAGIKSDLAYLCKEKQSALCIANFPSVKNFIKCPYASYVDDKGNFNVQYIVDGMNKKKASSVRFSLPGEFDGASFIAFYTPLKYSDGYVDTIVPSAGIVSNLFIEKYMSRQPYYIVAGPNYGHITDSGLVGPDYRYTMDELQIIEPFGVNCMVYRPTFGTFINANQTAKQTPVSALSKVHVRELVIYLQDEIEKVLQSYQWEFNNQRTRNAILDKANSICENVMANGGLQAYQNIMDESNNTPEIIDNEMAVLSTHIEPGMGCGKMVQELTIYRSGQMAATLSE